MRQYRIIFLYELESLKNFPEHMVLALAAAPVIPPLVDRTGQTFDVEGTVGMLEPFLMNWLDRIWVQFPIPHFFQPKVVIYDQGIYHDQRHAAGRLVQIWKRVTFPFASPKRLKSLSVPVSRPDKLISLKRYLRPLITLAKWTIPK